MLGAMLKFDAISSYVGKVIRRGGCHLSVFFFGDYLKCLQRRTARIRTKRCCYKAATNFQSFCTTSCFGMTVVSAFLCCSGGAAPRLSTVIDYQRLRTHREAMTNRETLMPIPNEPSPMLKAIDLMRVDIDAMALQDLEGHAVDVLDTIAALNDYINGGFPKSHNALLNALRLNHKLCLHMARVRDLIQARKSAYAMVQGMPSTSAPILSGVPAMGRRSRVIRPLTSADNATSGHIQILSNATQCSESKAVCGGEAKEVEPSDSLAKPDGERSEGGGRRW
jgi:hypothetical protein